MKAIAHLLLTGLLATTLVPGATSRAQEGEQGTQEQEPTKKGSNPIGRFYKDEGERLAKEIQGSWMLMEYTDPHAQPLDEGVSGFASFHDGFLTMTIAVDAIEKRLFRTRAHVFLSSGIHRYRFDQHATLQLASVMAFANDNDEAEIQREPSGTVAEYYVQLTNGVLELRDPDGVLIKFRQIKSGEFPTSAVRKLEGRRSGDNPWRKDEKDD